MLTFSDLYIDKSSRKQSYLDLPEYYHDDSPNGYEDTLDE
jgi:Asp-tRNA(Asn)/Glu-tRNA(Gln) amidotransferase B subunit